MRSSRGQLACLAAQSESDAPCRTPRSVSLLVCRHALMRQTRIGRAWLEALLMWVCPPSPEEAKGGGGSWLINSQTRPRHASEGYETTHQGSKSP